MRLVPLSLAVVLALPALALAAPPLPGGGISGDSLARDIGTLASDAFEGRAPGTAGEDRTVDYLVRRFREAGLEPAGEDGGWTQTVELVRSEIEGTPALSIAVEGERQALTQGEEIAVETLRPGARVHLEDVPLVFVGYGVHAPELGWDDYAGQDLHGKVAVVLVNDPDFETPEPGLFGGRAITYYGRWSYKYEEAARRGAAGVLIVHETAPAAYPWATVRAGRLGPQYDIVRDDAEAAHVPVRGWIQRDLAESLFARAGLDLEAQKRAAQRKGFVPVPLAEATFSADFGVERSRITSRNVLGLLPGDARPEETVVVSAHWDALGKDEGGGDGDPVHHGAVDNATGTASLIELARVFAAGERPDRSLLFLATTAEESGLLGAMYYAANPLRPLATTAADINMEMWSPDGPTHDISTWGMGHVSLERDVAAAAAVDGRRWSPDPKPEAGFFYRADHFAFAKAGVPAITVGPGMDQLEGGTAEGEADRAAYFATAYHQAADTYDADWDMRGPVTDLTTVYRLVEDIANDAGWPQWDAGSEFEAERAGSAAARAAAGD
ncbi:M28 family metallopeptidase [Coralloluteibacterium stylophorae]|uniref:M28 family peptidase n=1 Tax=Coralloluteibacterium stylophorae TaxID=1776034 RepID=A0A8J7VT88_9GAMM|nr:M28 family metallopeptidase [Coralloluteibacterium stylophorae]MBS7458195.1 M28 family peptidase [Coralloluteibacterium stylophorae]